MICPLSVPSITGWTGPTPPPYSSFCGLFAVSVLPSLFPLSECSFYRCLYDSFLYPKAFWVFAQMSLCDFLLSSTLQLIPSSTPSSLSLICFSLSLLSPYDLVSTCFIVFPFPLGCKLHEARDFSLFSSLPRILFGLLEGHEIVKPWMTSEDLLVTYLPICQRGQQENAGRSWMRF